MFLKNSYASYFCYALTLKSVLCRKSKNKNLAATMKKKEKTYKKFTRKHDNKKPSTTCNISHIQLLRNKENHLKLLKNYLQFKQTNKQT